MKNVKKFVALFIAASMMLSVAACDSAVSSKKSKKDKKDDDDSSAVIEAAEDFTKALKKLDASKIEKLSTEVEDDSIETIEDMADTEEFVAYMDLVKFEIDEDSAELDDDEASIDVEFTYIDVSGYDPSECDLDEYIDGYIDEEEDVKSGSFTIEFEVDDDEFLVSNAEDVFEDFFGEILDMLEEIEVPDTVVGEARDYSYESLFFCDPESYYFEDTEEFKVYFDMGDYPELNDKEIKFQINTLAGKTVYSGSTYFSDNAEVTVSVELEAGEYGFACQLDDEELDIHFTQNFEFEIYASDVTTEPTGAATVTGGDSEVVGNTYKNNKFGIQFDFSEDLITIDPATLGGALDGQQFSVDFICCTKDQQSFLAFTMIGAEKLPAGTTLDDLAANTAASAVDSEVVTISGRDYITFSNMGYDYYMTIVDDELFGICILNHMDDTSYTDYIVDSIRDI